MSVVYSEQERCRKFVFMGGLLLMRSKRQVKVTENDVENVEITDDKTVSSFSTLDNNTASQI